MSSQLLQPAKHYRDSQKQDRKRLSAWLRWLSAWVCVVVILVVVPAFLASGPSPLDTERGLFSLLDAVIRGSQVFDEALISALIGIGWFCWAYLVVSFIAEFVMTLRGLSGSLRGLNLGQSIVRPLVAGLWLSSTASALVGSTLSATAFVLADTTAAGASEMVGVATEGHSHFDSEIEPVLSDLDNGGFALDGLEVTSYLLKSGDTLWDLAHHHLGDGFRWNEIARLNPEIQNPDWIEKGTFLYLPADAKNLATPTDAKNLAATADEIEQMPNSDGDMLRFQVREGDTIWDLTRSALGDGASDSEIGEVIQKVDRTGLISGDPDLIYPGEVISIHADTSSTGAGSDVTEFGFEVAEGALEVSDEVAGTTVSAPRQAEAVESDAVAKDAAEVETGVEVTAEIEVADEDLEAVQDEVLLEQVQPEVVTELSDTAMSPVGADGESDSVRTPAVLAGAGALALAAALVAAVYKRREQRRHFRLEPRSLSPEVVQFTRELEAQLPQRELNGDGWSVKRIASSEATDIETDTAELDEGSESLLSDLVVLIGTVIETDEALELELKVGEWLRLNGEQSAVAAFCYNVALWLAVQESVKCFYLASEPSYLLANLRTINSGDSKDLGSCFETSMSREGLTARAFDVMQSANQDAPGQSRGVFLSAQSLNCEIVTELREAGFAVIAPVEDSAQTPLNSEVIFRDQETLFRRGAASEEEAIAITFNGFDRFERNAVEELLNQDITEPVLESEPTPEPALESEPTPEPALEAEAAPELEPEPALEAEAAPELEPEPAPEPAPVAEPAPELELDAESVEKSRWPTVRVLGAVDVTGVQSFSSKKAIDVLTYLAFHRQGATADQLAAWIWPPFSPPTSKALANVLSRARKALGECSEGEPLLSKAGKDRIYRLSPLVKTDFDTFSTLTKEAETYRSRNDSHQEFSALEKAVAIVRGIPFTGGLSENFSWADQHIRATIDFEVDKALHRATELAIALKKFATAEKLIALGLELLPGCEMCFTNRFELAACQNNERALHRAMSDLKKYCAHESDFGIEPSEEIVETFETQLARLTRTEEQAPQKSRSVCHI